MTAGSALDLARHVVTIATPQGRQVTSGILMRHRRLDAEGGTLSVLGTKSSLPDLSVGDVLVVCLLNGVGLKARVTHIHSHSDRFRAEVSAREWGRAGVGEMPELSDGGLPAHGVVQPLDPLRDVIRQERGE
ncbi:MAG: hypothetical protein HYU66_13815 [Armatimonadetes bacterium]|nr:hypothetical protein [Armatimonadota bacterium]